MTQNLQNDILTKWKEYERQAKALRPSWPANLDIKQLDDLINFIKERRLETEKRIKTLGQPSPEAATAISCPQGTLPLVCYTP